MAYVPQNVALMSGSIRENVALGIANSDVDDERIWEVLSQVDLASFLTGERQGLETMVGERGVKLSGGQRQRIGLARALYSRPRLLVLDEATSALDSQTERLITTVLASFDHSVTTITIAHRLATVQLADLVVYLEHGQILAQGTFSEVRAGNAAFAQQADLLGL
jgi:ABC-type multidrug transport system fused ATPase/permease subunit